MRKALILTLLAATALASQAALADAAVTWSPAGNITAGQYIIDIFTPIAPLFTCNITLSGTMASSSTLGTKGGQINASTINTCGSGHTVVGQGFPWSMTSTTCPTTTSVLGNVAANFKIDGIANFSGNVGFRFISGGTGTVLSSALSGGGVILGPRNFPYSPSQTIGCS